MSDDELLELLITGQLQPSDAPVVAAFRERPELASRWQELCELQQILTRAGSAGAPEPLAPERAARVERLVRAQLAPRRPWLAPVLLAAAAALVGAGALLWPQEAQRPQADSSTLLGSVIRVDKPRGTNEVVEWPDAGILGGRYSIKIYTRTGHQLLHELSSPSPSYRLGELAITLPKETTWTIAWKGGDTESPITLELTLD